MLEERQYGEIEQQRPAPGFSGLFSLFAFIVLLLGQNPDWGSNSLLWWGSIGIFLLVFFAEYRGRLTIEYNFTLWVLGFAGICAVSYFWAVDRDSVVYLLKGTVVNVVMWLLLRSSVRSEEDVTRILKLLLLATVICVVWLLLTNKEILEQSVGQDELGERLGSESKWNANSIGMMAATGMLIALYLRKNTENRLTRWVYLVVVPLMIFVALLSGSRKALVMTLMGFCGFVFLTSKGKRLRAIVIVALAVLGLYYLVMEVPFFYSIIGMRVEGFVASLTGVGEVDSSTRVREELRMDAMRVWREYPLFGCGLHCYQKIGAVKPGIYSHNNYTELLANLGIVGTVIYYSAHLYCLIGLLKIKKKDLLVWLLLIVLLIQLVMDYGCVSYTSLTDGLLRMLMFSVILLRKGQGQVRKCTQS